MDEDYCKQLEQENEELKRQLASKTVLEGADIETVEQTTEDVGISQLEIIQTTKDIMMLDQSDIDTEGAQKITHFYLKMLKIDGLEKKQSFDITKNTIDKYIQNVRLFTELHDEIEVILTKTKEITKSKKDIYHKFCLSVRKLLRMWDLYNKSFNDLIDKVLNDYIASPQMYTKFLNTLIRWEAPFQESICRVCLSILKIDKNAEARGLINYIKNDYCPETFRELQEYQEEIEESQQGVFNWIIKKTKNSIIGTLSLFKSIIKTTISFLINAYTNHYVACIFCYNLIVVGYKVSTLPIAANMQWFNFLAIIALSACKSLSDTAVLGAFTAFLVDRVLVVSTCGLLFDSIRNGIKFFVDNTISYIGPLLVNTGIKNILSGVLAKCCKVIEIFTTATGFTREILKEIMLTAFPSNIVGIISRIIDILTGNVSFTDIYNDLSEWYSTLSEGSTKEFAYYIGNSIYDFFNWFMKNSLDLISKLFNTSISKAAGYFSDIKTKASSFFGSKENIKGISKEVINNTDIAVDKIGGAIVATINKIKSIPTDTIYGACNLSIQTAKNYLTYVWNSAADQFGCSDFNQFIYSISIFSSVINYFYAIINGVLGIVPPVKRFVYDTSTKTIKLVGGVVIDTVTGLYKNKFAETEFKFINSAFFSESYFQELTDYNLFIGTKVGLLENQIKDLELNTWLENADKEDERGRKRRI